MKVLGAAREAGLARFVAPAGVGLLGAGAALTLHIRDPHESGSYGFCPFLLVTGQPCPGCGGLRAMHDLSNGDVVAALSSNLLAVVVAGGLALGWLYWFIQVARQKEVRLPTFSSRAQFAVLAVFVMFGVVRNTPWGAWLAP